MSKVEFYVKKPIPVRAVQYTGSKSSVRAIQSINTLQRDITIYEDHLEIATLEGVHRCELGDFVIQGIHGEIYFCKPQIFGDSYDIAPEDLLTEAQQFERDVPTSPDSDEDEE